MDKTLGSIIYTAFTICTAVIGHSMHHRISWVIIDIIFAPLVWLKWLICQEVNLTIIKHAFQFFFK